MFIFTRLANFLRRAIDGGQQTKYRCLSPTEGGKDNNVFEYMQSKDLSGESNSPGEEMLSSTISGLSIENSESGQEVAKDIEEYEDWLNKSQFNYTHDTMVIGPKDPLAELILEEFPETLIVPTVKSRSYVR